MLLNIPKGRDLFEILKESRYADFVCPEWFHIDGSSVTIDGREYDYGEYDSGVYSYKTPDSDGVQYESDEEWAEKYDSFMSNWQTARDMTNQEIVSILSSAKIGFLIDEMWIPMIFI